jgi:ketosteroid isomerase-like protein
VARTRDPVTAQELDMVRAGYEIWNGGDVAGMAALCLSDDIEWHNSPEWPGQRVYRGASRVTRFLKEDVADIIELGDIEIEGMDVYGDEIVITLQARTRGAQSDLDIGKIRLFHVARLEAGKVNRVRVYLEERQALEAVAQ